MTHLQLIDMGGLGGANTEQQIVLAEQLLQVLKTELAALEAGDASALAGTASDKARLLKSLDPQAPARMAKPLRERFEKLLHEARACNLRNGQYVAAQHSYIRARWAGLASIAGHGNFYNASGAAPYSARTGSALGSA